MSMAGRVYPESFRVMSNRCVVCSTREPMASSSRRSQRVNRSIARWVGVDAYVRTHTLSTASVLCLIMVDSHIAVDWTLRTRAGRTMPVGHKTVSYLNCGTASWYFEQDRLWHELERSWEQGDWAAVSERLSVMGSPDYLVVPLSQMERLHAAPQLQYAVEAAIGNFTILRRAS